MCQYHAICRRGFTLVELIITLVISSIMLLVLFSGFHQSLKFMGAQRDIGRALMLGEDLMDEVRSMSYYGFIGGVITSRSDCAGVDDYHLWHESPPQTMNGAVMSGFDGFSRSVSVELIDPAGFNFNAPSVTNDLGFKRIIVVVSNGFIALSNTSVISRYD